MSEVKPYTEEKHGHRIDYIQKMLDGGWDKFPADTVRWLLATIEAYKAREKSLAKAVAKENEEICQVLGAALGYPKYVDDQRNFPGSTPEHGVCVGDHVAISIAIEAAEKINALLESEADVEGARNAALEAAADVCARAGAEAHNKYNETIRAGCGVGGEHLYRFDMATALATSIRALKTTPTGGE